MKNLVKNLLFVSVPSILLILILLELVFRFVIPAANKPDLLYDRQEGIIHFDASANSRGVFTVGRFALQRGHWRVNNYGWNSPVDYKKEKDGKLRIAVIGDSFIESLMVDNTKTYPSLIRNYSLNSWDVYSFGISGAPLSQYLNMSRYVARHFDPDIFVINLVYNDFDESLSGLKDTPYFEKLAIDAAGKVTEVQPKPYHISKHKKLMKRSALVRYLYDNLKLRYVLTEKFGRKAQAQSLNANVNVGAIAQNKAKLDLLIRYVFGKLRSENPGKDILLVLDGPRFDIYNSALGKSNVLFMNRLVSQAATSCHLALLDLTPVFASDYQKHRRAFNSGYDSHWDEYGHKVTADTLYRLILKHRLLASNKKNSR